MALRCTKSGGSYERGGTNVNVLRWFRRFLPREGPGEGERVWLGAGRNSSGQNVTERTALSLSAVFSCVRVLAESVAQLPCKVYRRTDDDGKDVARNHPLYRILHDQPNPYMTAFTFWECIQAHLASWGNAFSLIDRDGAGRVAALWLIRPDRVWVRELTDGGVVYDVTDRNGRMRTYLYDEVLHVAGMGFDGLRGYSVVRVAAETIGQGMAAAEYAGSFFANDATPGGYLEHPGKLSLEAQQRLIESWEKRFSGSSKSHRIAVAEEGMKFNPISVNPEDAQLMETRKFNRSEIAGIFRVPPHMIGDLEHATFSNVEHQSIDFVKFSLSPWLKRIEQAATVKLLTPSERERYFVEFQVDGLLRGDSKSRNESHALAIRNGVKSINEVRREENLPPIEGGDKHYLQMQMTAVDDVGKGGNDGNGNDKGSKGNTDADPALPGGTE